MDLFEAFRRNRAERPGEAAFLITSGDRSVPIDWRRFTDDIALIARIIGKYAPGGVIGIVGENSYEWIAGHAACLFSGATVVPVDPGLSPDEIARRLRFVGASVLLHSSLQEERAHAVERLMPGLVTGGFGTKKTDRFLDEARALLAAEGRTVFDGPAPDRTKTSMIVFTSGTTSEPRGAELTIAGIEAFCAFATETLEMKPGDRSLMLLPLHHIFGICTTYMMLARGVSLGVCPDFRRIYEAVARFRVNFLFLVPALAEILAAKIERHGRSAEDALDGRLDWILIGGAPLPNRVRDRLEALGVGAITGYGLTETTSLYSLAPSGGGARPGTAGIVPRASGVETRVSESGELLIRGPNVMKGYFKAPEATARVLSPDGWFRTGDLGRIDADGFVWITGRASRTIILLSGEKVAPEELENRLLDLSGVTEVIVSGDPETREIRADVYAKGDEGEIRKAVSALNQTLPVHQRVSRLVFRPEPFPRTASGKIRLPRPLPSASHGENANGTASAQGARLSRGDRRLAVATPALLSFGIVLLWLSHAVPDICLLFGFEMPVRKAWICAAMEELGEILIVIALLMLVALAKRFFIRWRKPRG